jgi:hypothetical protein
VAAKHSELRDEIQSMVRDLKLFPTLRIDYTRIAFQPQNHDHVRVTIDLNMKFLKERTAFGEWVTPDERLKSEDQLLFPYSIVEIKLREPYISNPPKWLSDLKKSSLLHSENNFSKYIHGTYAFSQMENNNTLKLNKPIWFDNIEFVTPQIPVFTTNYSPKKAKPGFLGDSPKAASLSVKLSSWLVGDSTNAGYEPVQGGAQAPKGKTKVEPKTFFANERTYLSWLNCSLFTSSIGVALAAGAVCFDSVLRVYR